MRVKLIAVGTLVRETGCLSATCPNTLDITWLQQKEPTSLLPLSDSLQQAIDAAEEDGVQYDAIAVAAGLWDVLINGDPEENISDGVSPIHTERYPLILPRAHDWITLLLGSKERYREIISHHDDIWWLTPSGAEQGFLPRTAPACPFSGSPTALYIKLDGISQPDEREETQSAARRTRWDYEELTGDLRLLRNLLWGSWNAEDFLTLSPGQKVRPSFDRHILEAI